MALRPDAERRARIAEWRRRHPGQTPPVDIDPPGRRAPKRASREQRRAVLEVVDRHQQQLLQLTQAEMQALLPALQRAQAELGEALKRWTEDVPDGDFRWTAHSYKAARLLSGRLIQAMQLALGETVDRSTARAQDMALQHLAEEVARFSAVFGEPRTLALNLARELATGRSFIIPRVRTSAARYGKNLSEDIRQRLTMDILKGASVYETTERLVESRGPAGWVSLKGMSFEQGSVVENIPEGLFRRYRHWAERIVRTETASAYGAQRQVGLRAAAAQIPNLRRRWFADGSACPLICRPLDGVVTGIDGTFPTPSGPVDHEPAHPNCMCTTQPWASDWPALLGDIDPAFKA